MSEIPTTAADALAMDQRAARLHEVIQALAATRQPEEIFEIILRPALSALGSHAGWLMLLRGGQLCVVAQHGSQGQGSVWQDVELQSRTPTTEALRTQQPLYFEHSGAVLALYPELETQTGGKVAVASAVLPIVLAGKALGVIVLDFREPHDFTPKERRFLTTLASQCALALDRAWLAGDLERQARDRAAELEAFVQFTEATGKESDVLVLAQKAVEVLGVLFPQATCGYYALEDNCWRLRVYSPELAEQPALLASLQAGVPLEIGVFREAWQTGQASFVDSWDYREAGTEEAQVYQTVATYPLTLRGESLAMFGIGLKHTPRWSEQGRQAFQAVCRSLNLAIERTDAAQQLSLKNAELYAQTLALEGVAELTRDLTLLGGQEQLIEQVLELVLSLLPPGYAAFWEMRGEPPRWHLAAQRGEVGRPEWQKAREQGFVPGQIASLDQPWHSLQPLYQDHYDPAQDLAPVLMDHLLSMATLPVVVRGKAAGIFAVALFGQRQWTAADRALLETSVHSLGIALERAEQAQQLIAQRDLLEVRSRALQASNDELEAFTYSVSHDLRTPVRHIISFGALLRRSLPQPLGEKATRYFTVVENAALHLNHLIDGMLELSRTSRQPLKTEPVDLNLLFSAVRGELAVSLQGRQIRWEVAELPQVIGDVDLLRRVLKALLENAVKYTRMREVAVIEAWAEERGQTWAVLIKDNGVGFDPRYQDKLFSIFQRLHRQEDFEGVGVSLANARRIVARHDGLMFAEGQVGEGATFGFILPKPVLS